MNHDSETPLYQKISYTFQGHFPDIALLLDSFIFLFNALTSFYRLLQSNKWFLSELLLWGFFPRPDFGRVSDSLKGKATKWWEQPGPYIQPNSSKKTQPQMPALNRGKGRELKPDLHLQILPGPQPTSQKQWWSTSWQSKTSTLGTYSSFGLLGGP